MSPHRVPRERVYATRRTLITLSESSRTAKDSAVDAIGVGRGGVNRDNGASESPSAAEKGYL
jgi:hypothetical protein